MLETVGFIFAVLLIIVYLLTKDFFHPSFIVTCSWTCLLGIYAYADHPFWDLSDNFFKAITLWVFPFVFFSLLSGYRPIKISESLKGRLEVNVERFNQLYPYAISYSIIFILMIIYYAGGFSFYHIRQFLLREQLPFLLNLLFYINTFFIIYVFYGLLHYNSLNKRKVVVLLISLLLISIFKSNKTSFLAIFVGVLYVLKKNEKLKIRYLLILTSLLCLLLVLVTVNRADYYFGDNDTIFNYLYIYILSPLTAFDALINHDVVLKSGTFGESVLVFFYKIANAFGCNFQISQLGEWVNVPLPTNVFTVMRAPFLDGGYVGIAIVASLQGLIWGGIYALQNRGYQIFIVFYAAMINALFFQSFGDYLFYSLSIVIQYYIFSVIINRGIRIKF